MESSPLNPVTFVIGAPGSGKGTLCKALAAHQNYYHLSVGDYLRELMATGPLELAGLTRERLQKYMEDRELVPPETIVANLQEKLRAARAEGVQKILNDGFPRDLASAKLWDEKIGLPGQVLYFDCQKEEAKKGFIERQRDDGDDGMMFEKRYDEFCENNAAIIEHYGSVVRTIDTSEETAVSEKRLFAALSL